MPLTRKLAKAFAAVAIFSGVLGIVPSPLVPQAHAVTTTFNSSASMTAINAANNAAAARRRREDREAKNDAIVAPTAQHIARLRSRGLVDESMLPYIAETVAEMNIPAGTEARDITEAQRDHFIQALKDKRLVAEMSADTPDEAVALGMSSGLAPYFAQGKSDLGLSGAVTLEQAQALHERISDQHWENDIKPALGKGALVLGGVAAAGAAAYAINRRNRGY